MEIYMEFIDGNACAKFDEDLRALAVIGADTEDQHTLLEKASVNLTFGVMIGTTTQME